MRISAGHRLLEPAFGGSNPPAPANYLSFFNGNSVSLHIGVTCERIFVQHSSWLVVGKLMNKFDLNQITNKNDINQLLSSQIIYLESILKMNTSKINY